MFAKSIVRTPGKSMVEGISTAGLGLPDYELALRQHASYIEALKACGLDVTILQSTKSMWFGCDHFARR